MTLAVVAVAATVAATLVSAYGKHVAGKTEQAKANYQAGVDKNNQTISERNAADARERGKIDERAHRVKISQLKGRQRASMGASGIELDSGSALDILSDTAEIGELEALTIRNNAERDAVNFENQAANYGVSSRNAIIGGKAKKSAANLAAFGTLISGGGKAAGQHLSLSS